ncbi:MAG TPA: lipase family protein [Clostridia bacterium]|nr:lipase family protein [Clostridia bacterium]
MTISTGFSKGLALFLADCCLQAYNLFSFKGAFSAPPGYSLVASIMAAPAGAIDAYGFIIESPESIVISFRGSRSNPDWIADAAILQTYFPYTRIKLNIHSGFAAIYNACRKQIMDILNTLSSSKQLYITGHSLGGALAVLCALDTAANTAYSNPVMYNFGSPRVGSPQFVQTYNEVVNNSARIVNTNDIVPLLPPAAVQPPLSNQLLYYRHVKDSIKITVQTGSIARNHWVENYMNGIRAMS